MGDTSLAYFESLSGGTTKQERYKLLFLASEVTRGQIVEIGSYIGGSTIFLAKGGENKHKKVYAVDPHIDLQLTLHHSLDEFTNNIMKAHCTQFVVPILELSQDAAKCFTESIGLLFIDGLHDYKNAKGDFLSWGKLVIDGSGIVVFHDCWSVGVARTVSEMLASGKFSDIHIYQSLLWAKKQLASPIQMFKYRVISISLLATAYSKSWLLSNPTIKNLDNRFGIQLQLKRFVGRILG